MESPVPFNVNKKGQRSHPIMSIYPVLVEKIYISRRDKTSPVSVFTPSRLSYKKPKFSSS